MNCHKFSFVGYVVAEICGLFGDDENDPKLHESFVVVNIFYGLIYPNKNSK